jgi:hypothetical protein
LLKQQEKNNGCNLSLASSFRLSIKLLVMPGKDQEYQYTNEKPEANKASDQTSANQRGDGAKDDTVPHNEILQKENMKNKGSNKRPDDITGNDSGDSKSYR